MTGLVFPSPLLRREPRVALHAALVGVLCFVSTLTSSACEPASSDGSGDSPSPARFAVGTSAYEWRDESRPELYTEAEGDLRTVPVRVWYPALASDTERAPYFLNPEQAELTAQSNGLPVEALLGMQLPAAVDAPLPQGKQRFPVLVFSPGLSTPPEFYGYQLADLASRGYVVFALAHAYGSGSLVFADGSVAVELPDAPETPDDHGVRDRSVATWSADQRFVLSRVEELARAGSGDRLERRLDLAHVGVFGHSRGGAAAAQSCLEDARFRACANLDGSVSSAVLASSVSQPFLLMRSEVVDSTLGAFFASLSGPAHRIDVSGAGHNSFSDLPRLVRDLQLPVDEGLLLGNLDADRAFEINATYLAAFFDAELRGASAAWFFEPSPFAEVSVTHAGSAAASQGD